MKNILGINLLTFCALLYLKQVQQIYVKEKNIPLRILAYLSHFFEAPPTCIHKSETKGQFLMKKDVSLFFRRIGSRCCVARGRYTCFVQE